MSLDASVSASDCRGAAIGVLMVVVDVTVRVPEIAGSGPISGVLTVRGWRAAERDVVEPVSDPVVSFRAFFWRPLVVTFLVMVVLL